MELEVQRNDLMLVEPLKDRVALRDGLSNLGKSRSGLPRSGGRPLAQAAREPTVSRYVKLDTSWLGEVAKLPFRTSSAQTPLKPLPLQPEP